MKPKQIILCFLGVAGLFLAMHSQRYEIVDNHTGPVKMDQWTGKAWKLKPSNGPDWGWEWQPVGLGSPVFTPPKEELESATER